MNTVSMGVFAIMFLLFLSIISNSSPQALQAIQTQFNRLTCPMPVGSGLWNSSGTFMFDNFAYNKRSVSNNTLTLTCTQVRTQHGVDYNYGQPTVAIGIFFFINDYISEFIFNKVGAVLTILFFIVSPANFSILGFTIANLSGIGLMAIVGIYTICYIFIGVFIYKTISPFSGGA